jgi:hypothetical protein
MKEYKYRLLKDERHLYCGINVLMTKLITKVHKSYLT